MHRTSTPRTGFYAHLFCRVVGCRWSVVLRAGPLCSTDVLIECRWCRSVARAATSIEYRDGLAQ